MKTTQIDLRGWELSPSICQPLESEAWKTLRPWLEDFAAALFVFLTGALFLLLG